MVQVVLGVCILLIPTVMLGLRPSAVGIPEAARIPMLNSWIFVGCEWLRTRFFVSETYRFFVGFKPNLSTVNESTNISVTSIDRH
jgi:hypothetical protein